MTDSSKSRASPPSSPAEPAPPDRLQDALRLAKASAWLAIFGVAVVLWGPALRNLAFEDTRLTWVVALGRDTVSLWPAGRLERVSSSHPAVRTEWGPGLFGLVPPLAERP